VELFLIGIFQLQIDSGKTDAIAMPHCHCRMPTAHRPVLLLPRPEPEEARTAHAADVHAESAVERFFNNQHSQSYCIVL
jgi:hypothetical protein